MMSRNKKDSLVRPVLPNHEHILEDLNNAVVDDVAFKVINDLCIKECYGLTNINHSDDIYKKVKSYLNTKQQLKQLERTLGKESQQLQANNEEIRKLADDIRKQAQAALIT